MTGVVKAGVYITLSGASSATTTTAADGTYSFPNIFDGTYTVTPSLTGYGFTPGALTVIFERRGHPGADFVTSLVRPRCTPSRVPRPAQ